MKKYRKCHSRNVKKVHSNKRKRSRHLRSGSKKIKEILMERNPRCDICGSGNNLQLHHIYLIRHGYPTQIEHCTLLCPNCHFNFHKRWDKYLDITHRENPNIDFVKIYNVLKKL